MNPLLRKRRLHKTGIVCLIAKRLENAGDASQTVAFLTVILRRVIAKAQVKYVL
jgi:hypothetical protein